MTIGVSYKVFYLILHFISEFLSYSLCCTIFEIHAILWYLGCFILLILKRTAHSKRTSLTRVNWKVNIFIFEHFFAAILNIRLYLLRFSFNNLLCLGIKNNSDSWIIENLRELCFIWGFIDFTAHYFDIWQSDFTELSRWVRLWNNCWLSSKWWPRIGGFWSLFFHGADLGPSTRCLFMVKFFLSLQADVVDEDFKRALSIRNSYSAIYCAIFDYINVDSGIFWSVTFWSSFEIDELFLIGSNNVFAIELNGFQLFGRLIDLCSTVNFTHGSQSRICLQLFRDLLEDLNIIFVLNIHLFCCLWEASMERFLVEELILFGHIF